jgi:uncharacterized protein involved in exopolysaccharide biosynthesis
MRVTERLASLFIEENLHDREVLADGTNQFLEAQLEDARRNLIEQEAKLESYRKRYAGQLPSQLDANMQANQNTQLQLQSNTESLNRDRDRALLLQRQIADIEQQATAPDKVQVTNGEGADSTGLTPSQQLAAARLELTALQGRYKPEHPDVQRMERVIRDLEPKAAAESAAAATHESPGEAARRTQLSDLRAQLEQVNHQIEFKESEERRLRGVMTNYQKRIDVVPTRESELTELTRDYSTTQTMYSSLLAKKEESKIAADLERRQIGEQFKLLDPARLAEKPYSPNRLGISLAAMGGGLAVGLLLVALTEYRSSSLNTEADVTTLLSLPVLATVPFMQSRKSQRKMRWRRFVFNAGCAASVATCLAIVIYTLFR